MYNTIKFKYILFIVNYIASIKDTVATSVITFVCLKPQTVCCNPVSSISCDF